MKFLFTIGLLASWLAAFAQVPPTPAKPGAAPAKVLTPAEIRQKEKIAKVLEEERKYREDIAKAQRDYQAKQAEKERQRREKETKKQVKETTPAPAIVSQPEQVPEPTPVKKPKPERAARAPRAEKPAEAPVVQPDSVAAAPPAEAKPERTRRERPVEPTVPDANRAERDLVRQQQQAERDARKAERARSRASQPAEPDLNTPATAPEAARLPAKEFLPKGHLFAPILLDPLEAQTYVSVLPAFRTDGRNYPGTIVPFEFGFCKPFFRWTKFQGRASELSLDVASYTQFEVYYDDTRKTQRRQLINTDYKFSVIYNLLRNNHVWRFRFYHISSHLGDDFLFRNSIQTYTSNSVNYELVDITYSRTLNNTRIYSGVGFVLRKAEERKLLSGHAGFYYRNPKQTRFIRPVGGLDLKVWQQTDFRPGIKAAVGIEMGKSTNPLTFVLEGYTGFRPYSQYEYQHVRWLGIGFYFNPF
ncbi:MAG: DUF1207 domain-containing protein [Bacteroidetes bacterium]|nr:DUF1207 domain-containing protein [Fibrella sp.]